MTNMLHHKRVWLGGVELREEVYASDYNVIFLFMVGNEKETDTKNIEMGKESAIAVARAILKHFVEE